MEFTLSLPALVFWSIIMLFTLLGIRAAIRGELLAGLIIMGVVFGAIGGGVTALIASINDDAARSSAAREKLLTTIPEPWKNLHLYLNNTEDQDVRSKIIGAFGREYCTGDDILYLTIGDFTVFVKNLYDPDDRKAVRKHLSKCIQIDLKQEFASLKQELEEESQETVDPAKTFDQPKDPATTFDVVKVIQAKIDREAIIATMPQRLQDLNLYLKKTEWTDAKQVVDLFAQKYCSQTPPAIQINLGQARAFFFNRPNTREKLKNCIEIDLQYELEAVKQKELE